MARTHRPRPPLPVICFRERVWTRGERRTLLAMRDECAEAGLKLSEHRRYVPSAWDDLHISAAREGRWRATG